MTDIYERDLYGMKYSILKSPYHKKVVTACAEILGVPPMKMRRLLIENLDMMTLESLGVRYDSWVTQGDTEGGMRREVGYELFTTFIPVISRDSMEQSFEESTASEKNIEDIKVNLRKRVFEEEIS